MNPDSPSDGVVILTPFTPQDAASLREVDEDHEHRRRFDVPDDFVPSLQHSERVIAGWERDRAEGTRYTFAVRDARTADLLGGCEIRPREDRSGALSYWTLPRYRRGGIATRAVLLACRVAFDGLALERLEILTDEDNGPSRRVAMGAGFEEVGRRDGRILHVLEAGRA